MLRCSALFICKGGELMKKKKNSFLVWLLAAVLAIGMLPASALPLFADEPVNVATWMELKAALESDGDKTVKLTADVVHYDKITISGNKILELNGHKIRLKNKGRICVPAGAHLKVDGKVNGSEITSSDGLDLFCMEDGSLTIDEGRYTVFTVSSSVVYIATTSCSSARPGPARPCSPSACPRSCRRWAPPTP